MVQAVGITDTWGVILLTLSRSNNFKHCSAFIGHVTAASLALLGADQNFLDDSVSGRVTFVVTSAIHVGRAHIILNHTSWFTFSLSSSIIQCCAVLTAGRVWIWRVEGGNLARGVVVGAVRTLGTAGVYTVGLALVVSIARVPLRAFVVGVDTSWCAGSLILSIAVAVLAAGIRVPGRDLTEVVIPVAVSVLVAAGILTRDGDTLVILADGGGVLALVISQASWFAFADIRIIRLVAPLAGWTDSVPIVTIFIEPAAGDTGVGVLVTQRLVSTTVGVHAAFGVADPVLVR